MKKSNLFFMTLGIIMIMGMCATNIVLKKEYDKIDLTDPYKNYVSVQSEPYMVLDLSGSNGYPIEIEYSETNDIKVLRSRLGHFKNLLRNDTLFIQFTGSNIPMEQGRNSSTPAGIIIGKSTLSGIIGRGTHQRVSGFSGEDLKLILKGNAFAEISNCNLHIMEVDMMNTSQIAFLERNKVDSLQLKMANTTMAELRKIDFRNMEHTLGDSISFVLSKEVIGKILR